MYFGRFAPATAILPNMKTSSEDTTDGPLTPHKNRDFLIGVTICIAVLASIGSIVAFAREQTRVAYQPINACEAFNPDEAKSLIKGEVINGTNTAAQLSGDTAISKCAYSDINQDMNKMLVAAVTVRSAINDEGVAQNKSEFAIASRSVDVEPVSDVSESAFYNPLRGQLNVLREKQWLILSFGVGSTPQENTLDDLKLLAAQMTN